MNYGEITNAISELVMSESCTFPPGTKINSVRMAASRLKIPLSVMTMDDGTLCVTRINKTPKITTKFF